MRSNETKKAGQTGGEPRSGHPDGYPGEGDRAGYSERRLLPRLNLSSEQFRLSRTGQIYSVIDLSEKGMALTLLDETGWENFPVGMLIEGTLNLRRVKYPIQARVRNLNGFRIGCEFVNPSSEVSHAISSFLNPSLLGAEMKPLPSSEQNALWYHGPSGTDLIFRRAMGEEDFSEFTLYIFSTYIQWRQDQGLSTGKTKISSKRNETMGILRLDSLVLENDPVTDLNKLQSARVLIQGAPLPQDLKSWCTEKLKSSPVQK